MNNIQKETLNKIKTKALENHVPIVSDIVLNKILETLENKKVTNFLEIGAAVGYSAICFSETLENGGVIDTIERNEHRINEAKQNIKSMDFEYEKIKLFEGDAVEILPTFNKKYDVIFIDAAKGKYPFFLKEALRMLNDDGIIFADNILYKGYVLGDYNEHKHRTAVRHLREYIKEISENPNLDTEILDIGDGLAITKFSNNKD